MYNVINNRLLIIGLFLCVIVVRTNSDVIQKVVVHKENENGTIICVNTWDIEPEWWFRPAGASASEVLKKRPNNTRLTFHDSYKQLKIVPVLLPDAGTYSCSVDGQEVNPDGELTAKTLSQTNTDLLVLAKDSPTCVPSYQKNSKTTVSCSIEYKGIKHVPRMNWRQGEIPNNNVQVSQIKASVSYMVKFQSGIDIELNTLYHLAITFRNSAYIYRWNSSGISNLNLIRPSTFSTSSKDIADFTSTVNSAGSRTSDDEDESLIIILVVAVGGFLCLLIFSFLGVFIARRSKFAVSENFNRKIEPDIMRHRDLPEALSIANYSMREMPEIEQQPPENELYINQEEMRHDSQPEINISRASSHQSVPEYQNSIDEMLNQVKTCKKVGSDGTVYIELNGPKLTPTLPIRPRRLPAPPPEVMAHSNSMYALVDHKPRIPPPPPNDI